MHKKNETPYKASGEICLDSVKQVLDAWSALHLPALAPNSKEEKKHQQIVKTFAANKTGQLLALFGTPTDGPP